LIDNILIIATSVVTMY